MTINLNGTIIECTLAEAFELGYLPNPTNASPASAAQAFGYVNQPAPDPSAASPKRKVADNTGACFTLVNTLHKGVTAVLNRTERGANWVDTKAVAHVCDTTAIAAGTASGWLLGIATKAKLLADSRR